MHITHAHIIYEHILDSHIINEHTFYMHTRAHIRAFARLSDYHELVKLSVCINNNRMYHVTNLSHN